MLADKLVYSQVGAIAMLKWMVSVVLATKKYRTKEEAFSAFYGQLGTNVASAAKNLNLMPLSRRDVVLVVLCAMLVVQALAIVYLIKKLM